MPPVPISVLALLLRALARAGLTCLASVGPEVVQAERFRGDAYLLVDDGVTRLVRASPGRAPEIVSDSPDLVAFAIDDAGIVVVLAHEPFGPYGLASVEGFVLVPLADVPFAEHLSLEREAVVYRDARGREHRLSRRRSSLGLR
jgi:hypothetical protein